MSEMNLVDGVINEPLGGAHANREETFEIVKNAILSHFDDINKKDIDTLVQERIEKYANMGVYKE